MIILLVFKLKENLQALPQSLDQLVVYSLERLLSQNRHLIGLRWALAALTVSASGENFYAKMECKSWENWLEIKLFRNASRACVVCLHVVSSCLTGMRERELYAALNTCNEMSSRDGQMTWQDLLQMSRKAKGRIPMTTFTYIVRSLQRYHTDKIIWFQTETKMWIKYLPSICMLDWSVTFWKTQLCFTLPLNVVLQTRRRCKYFIFCIEQFSEIMELVPCL